MQAFRIEPLLNEDYSSIKPELVPHYKGRKRIHIEIRDNISKVGATLKRGLEMVDAVTKSSWMSLNSFSFVGFGRSTQTATSSAAIESTNTTTVSTVTTATTTGTMHV